MLTLSSLNFAGSQAGSAYVQLLWYSVNLTAYTFDIALPNMIGSSMRMTDIISIMYAFFTNCAFCHDSHLLAIS
jgi:hypothetical protein